MFKKLAVLFILALASQTLFAQHQKPIVKPIILYPDGVPNSKPTPDNYKETVAKGWANNVSEPSMMPFLPAKPNGTAVLIFPGGSYIGEAFENEGNQVAMEFNKIGVTAFVVRYRLPNDAIMIDKTIGPLQDAQRAIQIVRKRAAEWNINPNKVGVIGFSAGGHLASTIDTHYSKALIDNKDNISLRPDFAMLIYPVITFGTFTHAYSRQNLVGKNPSQATIDLYSNEKQVTPDTPPTFLVQAEDDDTVPVQNSLMFYDALVKNKVKAEMHILQSGGHGFGLIQPKTTDHWFDWAANWLTLNGF